MEALRDASLLLIILSTLGCGMTFRPTHPARIESAEADIDVVEARMGSVGTLSGGGLSVEVGLRTRMPLGARLRQLMFVSARLRPCSGVGLTASTIRLDGAEDDAGTSIDVAGEHLLRATFTGAGTEMLAGPVALDWYDDVNGERRCGRIALVDSEPQHAWTNESRWSLGVGFRGVLPLTPVGHVDGILDAPALVRYRTSERGALIGTLGLIGVSMCRSSLCSKTSTGADKGGATIPIGVGYDYTLVHAGRFAMGLGARYESRLTWVALRTGTNAILIHELSAVPRLAIVGPRRFPSRPTWNFAWDEPRPRAACRRLGRRPDARHLAGARRSLVAPFHILNRTIKRWASCLQIVVNRCRAGCRAGGSSPTDRWR